MHESTSSSRKQTRRLSASPAVRRGGRSDLPRVQQAELCKERGLYVLAGLGAVDDDLERVEREFGDEAAAKAARVAERRTPPLGGLVALACVLREGAAQTDEEVGQQSLLVPAHVFEVVALGVQPLVGQPQPLGVVFVGALVRGRVPLLLERRRLGRRALPRDGLFQELAQHHPRTPARKQLAVPCRAEPADDRRGVDELVREQLAYRDPQHLLVARVVVGGCGEHKAPRVGVLAHVVEQPIELVEQLL
mmetsp:Transcript_21740/g.49958  ORF Transcript_21740/g.49958 Transcript_21740/m.49958 type:complete len:249 (+) Transcript_21740:395-1141(+)